MYFCIVLLGYVGTTIYYSNGKCCLSCNSFAPCILVSCSQTLVTFLIWWYVPFLLASSSSVVSNTSQISPLFLPCLRCSSRRVLVLSLHVLFPWSSLLSLSHAISLLPVNTLLRPPLAQSWICFPNDRLSNVHPSVSLDAIYHCRWIALPSFSLLSNPSSNLVFICTVLLSLLGSVAFLFLCCRV